MNNALTQQVLAPAKLNLFLHVTAQREDGYHELQSLFTPIALYDELSFSRRDDGLIERLQGAQGVSASDDLVVKAAHLLKNYTETTFGATISVKKHIPMGAGLGGGSSDAATTLLTLNTLWETSLSQEELMRLGVSLGADVPFFIQGQTAIATGIGEKLSAFSLPSLYYLVLRPALSIPTPMIFKSPHLSRNSLMLDEEQLEEGKKRLAKGLHFGRNDLETVAYRLFPALEALMHALNTSLGLSFQMTGSGSCFFMPFVNKQDAITAQEKITAWQHTQGLRLENTWVVSSL